MTLAGGLKTFLTLTINLLTYAYASGPGIPGFPHSPCLASGPAGPTIPRAPSLPTPPGLPTGPRGPGQPGVPVCGLGFGRGKNISTSQLVVLHFGFMHFIALESKQFPTTSVIA